jgi:hypothetical protein
MQDDLWHAYLPLKRGQRMPIELPFRNSSQNAAPLTARKTLNSIAKRETLDALRKSSH